MAKVARTFQMKNDCNRSVVLSHPYLSSPMLKIVHGKYAVLQE